MLFTAGLLNRLRWRCSLAAGDLAAAAAAAHDKQITATSRHATPRVVPMRGASSPLHRCSSSLPPSPPTPSAAAGDLAARQGPPLLPREPPRLAGRRAAATTDRIENFETMRGRGGIGSGSKWLVVLGGLSSQLGAERRPLPLANKWAVRSSLRCYFCHFRARASPLLDQNAPL